MRHVMSALPPKADIGTRSRHVRFGSKADNRMPRKTAAKSLGLYGVYIIGTNRKPCRLNEHDADFFSASRNHVRAGADVSATEDMNDGQDNPVAGGGRCRCGVWRDAVACDVTTTPDDPRRGFGRSSRRQLAGCRASCRLERGRWRHRGERFADGRIGQSAARCNAVCGGDQFGSGQCRPRPD